MLKLYDTQTRSVRPFEPLDPARARVYACGPTVYDNAHIGNFRSFVAFDILNRYLRWRGYDVTFVMNLTDVDDKTIQGAADGGRTLQEHTAPFAEAFLADSAAIGIRPADRYPRATDFVERMVAWVETLVEKDLAYVAEDGSVYFAIARFPEYGKLSGVDLEGVRAGARVAQDEHDKDDARDFVLWKAAKPIDTSVGAVWESPWGPGRPGWHLECSVMSTSELGDTLDLHLGGEDLIFPHHEGEIAQSEGVTGEPFVRHWFHSKHLVVEGRKMSKSLGNFFTVRELIDDGVEPAALRHLLITAHYRSELNFTRAGLDASAQSVRRLRDFRDRLDRGGVPGHPESAGLPSMAEAFRARFTQVMDDDLDLPQALAALFDLVREVNAELDAYPGTDVEARRPVADVLDSVDEVLGILSLDRRDRAVNEEFRAWVEARIDEREEARAARDFARADAIREALGERGVTVEDGPAGPRWTAGGSGSPAR